MLRPRERKADRKMESGKEKFLSVDQVAARLGISRRQVYRLWAKGELLAPVKMGRLVRWPDSEIDLFMA